MHRFRLRRQRLAPRGARGSALRVLAAIGGTQAQLPSAAELSLASRVEGLTRAYVARALGADRSIVRAWCMRRTLFWLPASEVALFTRGTQRCAEKELRWARNHGISVRELDRMLAAMDEALTQPRSRKEFCQEVAEQLGRPVASRRGGGWGGDRPVPAVRVGRWNLPAMYLLHLYGTRRAVCVGPTIGGQATYVRADRWVRGYRDLAVPEAEEVLARRYLGAYGPAAPEDFARWTGIGRTAAAQVWDRLEDEIESVSVGGWTAEILKEDASAFAEEGGPSGEVVRLLPHFDTYLLGHEVRRHLVGAAHHRLIYRDQGWISPALLVDGVVVGTWGQEIERGRLAVRVRPFASVGASVVRGVRGEAERLARYLEIPAGPITVDRSPDEGRAAAK